MRESQYSYVRKEGIMDIMTKELIDSDQRKAEALQEAGIEPQILKRILDGFDKG